MILIRFNITFSTIIRAFKALGVVLAAAGMALHTLHTHVDVDRLPAQWNTTETADCIAIPNNILFIWTRTDTEKTPPQLTPH